MLLRVDNARIPYACWLDRDSLGLTSAEDPTRWLSNFNPVPILAPSIKSEIVSSLPFI